MSEHQDKSALPAGTVVRGYRLLDVLGSGGFGVTYMAEDSETGERVAVKEYLPTQCAVREGATVHPKSEASRADFEWGLDRFLSEAGMLTRFRHPNIVGVKGYFEANNTAYIVMQYEEGEPLDKLLDRRGRLTEAQLKRVLLPIADGLRQVHARGVWHRDVKPANIFVRRSNESPVLLDFGAARNALGARSASMTAIVTPPYAPPEQYDSLGELGAYTDVYALSALCWRAIMGELPEESPYRQRLASRGEDPLPLLSELRPRGYSVALLRAIDWGLQLDERERPQSVEEWLDAMGGGDAQAAPPDPQPAQAMPAEPERTPPASPDVESGAEWQQDEAEVEEPADEAVLPKLLRGGYGLANTYWWFGVFGGVAYGVATFVAARTEVEAIPQTIFLIFVAYWLVVSVGVWRAAGTYSGWEMWPVLARTFMLFGVALLVMVVSSRVGGYRDALLYMPEDTAGGPVGDSEDARSHRAENAFTIETVPENARVRILNIGPAYRDGMELPPGSYRVEASAEGHETATEVVYHGGEPTVRRIALRKVDPSKAGDRFRDCGKCPEMVVVPAGSYRMGSPSDEKGRFDDESPMRRVTIGAPFAVARHELTFAQWDACAIDGGCPLGGNIAYDDAWGRGQRPAISVSWDDAQRYVQWLSRKTKRPYRLLSESEWEYAARAGAETAYSWGDQVGVGRGNCDGCGSEWDGRRTAPVGSFAANAWGLHDMHGNVWEWVDDCGKRSYAGAPSDGSAWLDGDCSKRGLRGGSWHNDTRSFRAATRHQESSGDRYNNVGFRVARALTLSTEQAPFTIETVPAHARVRILNIRPAYRDGMQLPPGNYRVEASAEGYETMTESVRHGAGPTVRRIVLRTAATAGDRFRDCPECPEMVVIPAGSFRMGSPSHEEGRSETEGPVHEVTFATPFALGRHEVTVAEFGRFVDETGYSEGSSCQILGEAEERVGRGWRNPAFDQNGQHPVVCVSWNDAQAYVAWLSRNAGQEYRLPSESEWEYATRGGTATAWPWGGSGQCDHANGADASVTESYTGLNMTMASCHDGHVHTAPAGSFGANGWGLYDMLGNVWEWTEDCWNDSYAGAPSDGEVWREGDCGQRVLRGGSYLTPPSDIRAATRGLGITDFHHVIIGFRVARTLTQ